MYFQSLLFVSVLAGYCGAVSLPVICKDIPICTALFGPAPVDNIEVCHEYETQTSCCATCKNLIGALNHPDPNCPWGNAGDGINLEDGGRLQCDQVSPDQCSYYCIQGELFYLNCCQSCQERCSG